MIGSVHGLVHAWLASHSAAFVDHLVISSLFLLPVLLLSSSRFVRPRTRHALLMLGVAKFLVPAAMAGGLSRLFSAGAVMIPSFSAAVVFRSDTAASPTSELWCVAAAIWGAGAVLILVRALSTQFTWRRLVRGTSAPSQREIGMMYELFSRSSLHEIPRLAHWSSELPTTVGLFRPVVLLPRCSADSLDDGELRAVLAHELGHVERRHNLAGIVQTVAVALFWFNPLVWLANSRLRVEAEKDCDEHVLGFVSDPQTYLSGILKSSYGFIAPQPAGVSCMSTSHLKERMDHLMKHNGTKRRSVPHRLALLLGVAGIVLTTVFVSAGGTSHPAGSPVAASVKDDGVTSPRVITRVEPVYPESARANKVQGIVILSALIDDKGDVLDATVSKGIEGEDGKALEDAAVTAVRQWKFDPARKDGKPVTTRFALTIRFLLADGPKK